jgi:hypothetical protein
LIDDWTFDVFALSDASAGSPLRYLGIDLLNRYGVIHKFKVRKRFPFPLLFQKSNKVTIGSCSSLPLCFRQKYSISSAVAAAPCAFYSKFQLFFVSYFLPRFLPFSEREREKILANF